MGFRSGVGIRRHYRTRSLEPIRHAPRRVDFRHLESISDPRGAGHDSSGHGTLRPVLCGTSGHRSMMRWGFALLLITTAATAAPSPDELARCVAIPEADARLACYDTLAHRLLDRAPNAANSTPAQSAPPPAAEVAGVDAAKDFGLTPAQRHLDEAGPRAIIA